MKATPTRAARHAALPRQAVQNGRLHRLGDHLDLWPKAIGELAGLVAAKKLTWRETIRDGLENAPQALVDLLHGENFGKMLVRVN